MCARDDRGLSGARESTFQVVQYGNVCTKHGTRDVFTARKELIVGHPIYHSNGHRISQG